MSLPTPIHPAYAAINEARKKLPPMGDIPLEKVRENMDKRGAAVQVPDVIEEDRVVDSEDKSLRLTLLRPLGTEDEMLPVVIYYHGGGFISGSKYTHRKVTRDICTKSRVAIVFVEYSLAPEAKFPLIHEECYATLQWVLKNGRGIKVDTNKLAVCGDSAGGNLAIAIPLMAKQRGLGDVIKAQIAYYPVTASSNRERFPSYQEFGNGDYPLSRKDVEQVEHLYFEGEGGDKKWAAPLLASLDDLRGLPPALIMTSEADLLRDEAEEYGRKLTEAGVKTATVRLIGGVHGMVIQNVDTPIYLQSLAMINQQLDEAFKGP
ncbi:hypothetical protein O0I10_010881 [Lichtheimia ornata]|uniref:Alpha/beta hydrolase fold-3 domain-containing protein n=1 Tax=Lichtheimia ornata TaxID=688661 RepID=A0AAD7UVQ2_9FUNG|nr:uncharacterized protein O0I10_010881 [Lichtheimia ornata]KAJ8653445.1 hypothetical protein O0I10_010881 [Lichtheimia ornata]